MAKKALFAGLLSGFGNQFVRDRDIRAAQERQDFVRAQEFLLGTLDRPDLTPEGKQYVSKALRDLYGQAGKGPGGASIMDFYDVLEGLHGQGGTVQTPARTAGPAPTVEGQLPQRPDLGFSTDIVNPATGEPETLQAAPLEPGRGTVSVSGGPGGVFGAETEAIPNPYFRSQEDILRDRLRAQGGVEGELREEERQRRIAGIDALDIDDQTKEVLKAQIQTGMSVPSRAPEALQKVYDPRDKTMKWVPRSEAAYTQAEGPKEAATEYTKLGDTGKFIADRETFYKTTKPEWDDATRQTAIRDDLEEWNKQNQTLQDLEARGKRALALQRERKAAGKDKAGDKLKLSQAVSTAHSNAMQRAKILADREIGTRAMQARIQESEDPAAEEATLYNELLQQHYEDSLVAMGVEPGAIARIIGGTVNPAARSPEDVRAGQEYLQRRR